MRKQTIKIFFPFLIPFGMNPSSPPDSDESPPSWFERVADRTEYVLSKTHSGLVTVFDPVQNFLSVWGPYVVIPTVIFYVYSTQTSHDGGDIEITEFLYPKLAEPSS